MLGKEVLKVTRVKRAHRRSRFWHRLPTPGTPGAVSKQLLPPQFGGGALGRLLAQDVVTIRGALIEAFGTAWGGLRAAAAEAVEHSMGTEAKEAVCDSMDLVGDLASLRWAPLGFAVARQWVVQPYVAQALPHTPPLVESMNSQLRPPGAIPPASLQC